jgi:hypothetical protein
MATESQIAANRRNSQKSTGPRSARGQAASRFNALKHGIDAKSQCIPGESHAALEKLAAEYHLRFAPATPEERCLVDTLVSCEWDLRRYRAAAAQLWQLAASKRFNPNDDLPLAEGFDFCDTTFMRLQRAIDSAHRNYHRALKTLQALPSAGMGLSSSPVPYQPDPPAERAYTRPPRPQPSTLPAPKLASFRKSTVPPAGLSSAAGDAGPLPALLPQAPDGNTGRV